MSADPRSFDGVRILHATPAVGRLSYGLGPAVLNLAAQQQRQGLDSRIWSIDSSEEALRCETSTELRTHTIVPFAHTGPATLGLSPQMERAALGDEGQAFSIMHQHGLWTGISRVANLWRGASGMPLVLSPHGFLSAPALARSRFKKAAAGLLWSRRNFGIASCLVATSSQEAADCRRYGLSQPIAVISHGIAGEWLSSAGSGDRFREMHGLPPGKRLMLFLSRVHPHKGLGLLIEAMANAGETLRDWMLVVAGPDQLGYSRELESMISRLGLSGRAAIVGPVYGQEKRDAFAAAEVFVLPSKSENFSFAIVEALGAGVPVITTKGTPWEELSSRGCGWWVDVDSESIGGAIVEMANSSAKDLAAMGERGRALVAERYTWPEVGRMSVELYKWLLGFGECPDFVQT